MIMQEKNKSYEKTNSEFVEFVSIPLKLNPFKNPHTLPTEPMGIDHSPHRAIPIPYPYPWESPYPRQPRSVTRCRDMAIRVGLCWEHMEPHLGGRGGRRGSAMVPLEIAMVVSCRLSIVTVALSVTIRSDPLHVLFYGGVFGDGGSNGAIFDSNKFKMAAAAILGNFEWPYLRNGSRSTYIARIARSSFR